MSRRLIGIAAFSVWALVTGLGAGTAKSAAAPAAAKPEPVSWGAVDGKLVNDLFTRDLAELAAQAAREPAPDDPADLVRRFDIFVRAGHAEDAAKTADALSAHAAALSVHELSSMADFLIGREEWDLARRFLERFPQAKPGWGYVLVNHWVESVEDPKKIDKWLAARPEANPIDVAPRAAQMAMIDEWLAARAEANRAYWLRERVSFRARIGTEDQLLESLTADVKANPEDAGKAHTYLEAVTAAAKPKPLDWLGDVCRPKLAHDSYDLGRALQSRSPRAACALLELSLATPLTQEDEPRLQSASQMRMTDDQARAALRRWTKTALVECYKQVGEAEKAQKLMEELVASEAGAGMPDPRLARLAGQVQGMSGRRVVERRVREQEQQGADSPKYWLSRATYFIGRAEHAEAEKALKKALELAPPAPAPRGKSPSGQRAEVLNTYWRYLAQNERATGAVDLLRAELSSVPVDAESALVAARGLIALDQEYGRPLNPDDDVLWTFLGKRAQWDYVEERMLWRMVEHAPPDGRDRHWTRAEKLAQGADPSRALELGWIMSRTAEPARAIPLLRDAISRLDDKHKRERGAFNLFEVYLDTGDWKSAEATFPAARAHLTASEVPVWYGRIAARAARAGAADDAMRLWRARANLDLARLDGLRELAAAGLKDRLREFYADVKKKDPASAVPDRALELLQ